MAWFIFSLHRNGNSIPLVDLQKFVKKVPCDFRTLLLLAFITNLVQIRNVLLEKEIYSYKFNHAASKRLHTLKGYFVSNIVTEYAV